MVEPLGYDDILSIMNTFGFTKTWLAGKMKLTRQAVNNAMNLRTLSENADYRFRLLATYILKDEFKEMR